VSKLSDAARSALAPGERPVACYDGESAGLNASSTAGRNRAAICVGSQSVVISRLRLSLRVETCRIPFSDILEMAEGNTPMTGLSGMAARKNANHLVGQAMGLRSDTAALTLRTRRGDITFGFGRTRKAAANSRAAFVALSDMMDG
jgi:hypothetical protein